MRTIVCVAAWLSAMLAFSACSEELEGPTPSLESLAPSVACNAQIIGEITLSGAELSPLALDAATGDPRLAIPDISLVRVTDLTGAAVSGDPVALPNDPDDPAAGRVYWDDDATMRFEVFPELGLEPGLYEVTVTNRNGKSATLEARLAVIAPPVLESVEPDLVCNAESDRTLTLSGEGFASIDDALPVVSIGGEELDAASLDDCEEVPGAVASLSLCKTLTVVLPQDAEEPGVLDVQVTNPEPAQCESEVVTMALVPEPSVASVEPDLFCTADGAVSLTVSGDGFIDVDGDLPTVLFGSIEVQASAISGCSDIDGTTLTARSCTTLTVEVAPGTVPDGVHEVFVRNPDPAGCTSNENVTALVAGAPVVDQVDPPSVCSLDLPSSVTLTGSGFLRVADGAGGFNEPEVLLDNGVTVFSATISAMNGCEALMGTTTTGESCTSLTFDLPNTLAADSYELSVVNPDPAGCTTSEPIPFDIAGAPTLVSVAPSPVCSAGDTITVTGTGFGEASEILIDGSAIPTTFVSDTELRGDIQAGFTPDIYDVSVTNSGACVSDVLTDALVVAGIPVVFFVDPPFNFSGISVRLTVWVSGINGGTPTVSIRPTGTTDTPIVLEDPVFNGSNQILVTLPAGVAAGDYDVLVDDQPCPAEIINALHITDTPTVHISEMDPTFGAEDVSTGVVIRSDDPTPQGFVNFEVTPRAYLTPAAGGVATELLSVSFESAAKLSGVVPPGLTPGDFDLIVVNPDGQVGVLENAFRVLPADDPPPEIADLLPSQTSDGAAEPIQVVGSFFPADAANVSVTAECLDPSNAGAGTVSRTATVLGSSFSTIDTQWDLSGLAGFVCVVRVANELNATFTEFSALAVTNSSGNINSFVQSGDMIEPRRALGAAALRLNNQSRFIYAIGGDGGDDGVNPVAALASVEAAPVDSFGEIGQFSVQRNSLPEALSFVGVDSVESFIYAVGGRAGAAPGTVSDAVLRAYLLDPDEAPVLEDISLDEAQENGLPGGIFYYRVSAVMAADDPNNPSGESLPSQPFVVQLPALDDGVAMTLFWDAIPGAVSYRLYRSPQPDLPLGSEVLLAEIANVDGETVQSFVDDGSIDNSAATDTPLPIGSLGVWHQVGTLTTAREGAAVVAVPDPVNQDIHYLYAFGGRDATGAVLGSYEYVAITAVASNDQQVGAFQVGTETLDDPRFLAGAVYLDETRTPEVQPDTAWVYVLKGSNAGGASVNAISLYEVDTANGGELINEHDILAGGNFAGGYGSFAGNNTVFVFGGGGSPSDQGRSGLLGEDGCPACFPDLLNLNAGFTLSVPRFLHASTNEGAFIYLLGGETDVEQATRSTERTNL